MNSEFLTSIFEQEELESIKKAPNQDRKHPLKRLLFPEVERDSQVSINTEIAIRHILPKHRDWILKLKKRLLALDDYSHSSSALSEIRAFGDLLMCGISVEPVITSKSKKTPEFVVMNQDPKVFIEVHAKQINNEEAKSLSAFIKNPFASKTGNTYSNKKCKVSVAEHICTPFGKPKLRESVTENVISKIAQRKNNEGQFSENAPSILWLDFQDESWDMLSSLMVKKTLPVMSANGAFYSGDIWYAFYGWKGAPIFENFSLNLPYDFNKMSHCGRFRDPNTKIDAAIISFERDIVILENPWSQKPVNPSLWKQFFSHKWFNFEYSYMNWPTYNLSERIKLDQQKIMAIAKEIER